MHKQGLQQCPNCKETNKSVRDVKNGVEVCSNCGLVQKEGLFDPTAEWNNYSGGDGTGKDQSRAHGKVNKYLVDSGVGVDLSNGRFDRFQYRFKSSKDLTISKGTQKIRNWGDKLEIQPNVQEEAKSIFSQITLKKGHKGSSIDSTIATILFIASKITGGSLSLQKLENITGVKQSNIKRYYKKLKGYVPSLNQIDARTYVYTFCTKLQMDPKLIPVILSLSTKILQKGLIQGKNPRTVACVSIFMITQLSRRKIGFKKLSKISNLQQQTIKEGYQKVYSFEKEFIPEFKGREKNTKLPDYHTKID